MRTAEGGIQDIIDSLRTVRELAINSATDTNTDFDRAIIQKEFAQHIDTINDIASTTNYNGRILLDGTYWLKNIGVRKIITDEDTGADDTHVSPSNPTNNSGSIKVSGTTTALTFDNSNYLVTDNKITGLFPEAFNQYLGTASQYTPYSGLEGYTPEYYRRAVVVNPPIPNTGNLDVYKLDPPYLQYNDNTQLYYNYNGATFQNLPVGTLVATHPIVGAGTYQYYHTGQVVVMPGNSQNFKVVEALDDNAGRLYNVSNAGTNNDVRTAVEVDFSAAFANAKNKNSSATWENTFHGQGFTILQSQNHDGNIAYSETDYNGTKYTGYAQGTLISVVFDATQTAGTGNAFK